MKIKIYKDSKVFFDCDGVVLDSNTIKTKSFIETFEKFGYKKIHIYQFIKYHKKNGGVSRYKKIDYFFSHILKIDIDEKIKNKILKYFASIVYKKLLESNLTDSILKFLNLLKDNSITCYIISGSDELELNRLFKKIGLKSYFLKIYGSPKSKIQIADILLNKINHNVKNYYFGDSVMDYETSRYLNIDYIMLTEYTDQVNIAKFIKNKNIAHIKNFSKLEYIFLNY